MSTSSSSESPPESTHRHPVSDLMESIFSYDNNTVMLGALISLLLVILFVLLLHLYARCFLAGHSHRRRNRRRHSSSAALGRASFALDLSAFPSGRSKHHGAGGLDSAAIAAIPLFVFDSAGAELECVICLSGFDHGEAGRRLHACGHEFHQECLDMWLGSHSSCPICRASAAPGPPRAAEIGSSGSESADPAADGGERGFVVIDIVSAADHIAENDSGGNDCASVAALTESSSSSSSFGCSLKRMLSRNRSDSKVFPATSSAVSDDIRE